MRKKLFAILMSAMMMVTFMPSMAFATNPTDARYTADGHHYVVAVDEYGYAAATAVKNAWNTVSSNVYVNRGITMANYVAPTATADGSVDLICTDKTSDGYECGEVITVKIANPTAHKYNPEHPDYCSWSVDATVLPSDYAAAKVAQGDMNQGQADLWLAGKANVCSIVTLKCKNCGALRDYSDLGANYGEKAHEESYKAALGRCDKKHTFTCTKCGKTATYGDGAHGAENYATRDADNNIIKTKVAEACCNHGDKYEYTCKLCGNKFTDYEGTAKSDAHVPNSAAIKVETKTSGNNVEYYYEGSMIAGFYESPFSADEGFTKNGKWQIKNGFFVDATYDTPKFYKWDAVKTAATCLTAGKGVVTCKNCGDKISEEGTITKVAHAWETKTVAATCTADGYTYQYCKTCGYYYDAIGKTAVPNLTDNCKVATTDKKTGHSYVVTKQEATCETAALYTVKCSVCGAGAKVSENVFTKKTITNSDFGGAKTSVYLQKDGTINRTHTAGEIEVPYIDGTVAHHKYTKKVVLKEATCNNPAIEGYKCDTCGKVCMDSSSAFKPVAVAGSQLDHKKVEVKKAATCGSYGTIGIQCELCKKYLSSDESTWKSLEDIVATEAEANYFVADPDAKPLVSLNAKCDEDKWIELKAATIFEEGAKALGCSKCGSVQPTAVKTVVAKLSYAAPKVSVKKGKVVVTVAAQDDAVKYVVKAGKKTKTVTAAGKVTLKKVAKKGKKVKVTVTAYNAAGAKVVSKAKTVKAK